tara:strand:- start:224 stop:400 length:177 start_codon:yes stop_codon:yes gene_type:complete
MFKKIISFLFGDKKSNIRKKIDAKYKQAIEFQRNGNIRQYSVLMSEIEKLENEYESLV